MGQKSINRQISGELVFVCQHKLGGVQNFYRNLLLSNDFTGFTTKVIYTSDVNDNETKLPSLFDLADQEIVFPYDSSIGEYNNFKALSSCITNNFGVVFTNFPLELSSLQHYRLTKKTVVFAVHDEWYIQNAIRYGFLIDKYVTHNPGIYQLLCRIMPDRNDDIVYLPYGIQPAVGTRSANADKSLRLLFIGRLHAMKGIYDLLLIDELLKKSNIQCKWTVIGDGPESAKFRQAISDKPNFKMLSPDTTEEVLTVAMQNDVFVLPSKLEGLPVSLLEAMSAGLIPVIGLFNEGITSVVTPDIGYVLEKNDNEAFAAAIEELDQNRGMLEEKSRLARLKVENEYDALTNTAAYYKFIVEIAGNKSSRKSNLPVFYGNGRLDKKYMPGWLLKIARKAIK